METDELKEAMEFAERVEREGGGFYPKFTPTIDAAVQAVLRSRDEYFAERGQVSELLKTEGIQDFVVVAAYRFPPSVRVSDQLIDGVMCRTFLDSDPPIQHLQQIDVELTDALRKLADFLRPIQPLGWRGTYRHDICSPTDLRDYVSHCLTWAKLVERSAVRTATEAALNVDGALVEWKVTARPVIPASPTSSEEAISQIARLLHWLDSRVPVPDGLDRVETTEERNERWVREAAKAAKARTSNAEWCRQSGVDYDTFRKAKGAVTRKKRARSVK